MDYKLVMIGEKKDYKLVTIMLVTIMLGHIHIYDSQALPAVLLIGDCISSCSEISKAQDRLTDKLQNIYTNQPGYRELLRMIMSTVGRGGEGDVGQRIRDEILVIQVIIVLISKPFFSSFL